MKPYLQYLFYPKTVLVPSFSWTSRIDKSHSGADIAIQWYGVLLPVILNEVKDLGEQTVGSNRFFAYVQNDKDSLRMTEWVVQNNMKGAYNDRGNIQDNLK